MADNVNSGHRKRMRQSFLNRDFDAMPEHEILELLLFYAYPRCDTNKIAHRLINRFGNLQGVCTAPFEELVQVEGVGESAATLIILFSRLSQKYSKSYYNRREYVDSEKLFEILRRRFQTETDEVVIAVFCDQKRRFISMAEISRGYTDMIACKPKDLVAMALRYGASRLILAHNHPNGIAIPSMADIRATRDAQRILAPLDLMLEDHIIVAGDECYSMRDSHKFEELFGN